MRFDEEKRTLCLEGETELRAARELWAIIHRQNQLVCDEVAGYTAGSWILKVENKLGSDDPTKELIVQREAARLLVNLSLIFPGEPILTVDKTVNEAVMKFRDLPL